MKKLTYSILMITVIIILVNPLSSNAGSGYSGGGHSGSSYSVGSHSGSGYSGGGHSGSSYSGDSHSGHSYSGGGHQSSGHSGRSYSGGGYHGRGYHGRYYGGYHGYYGYHYGHYGYWYGGWWYPWVGIIPYLPFYYQTMWIDGYPYYYADGDYYAPTTNGYMVVNPQPQAVPPQTGQQSTVESSTKLFIYPRNGQSEKQQAEDRYQCDRWAVGQTGYDPTKPAGGMSSVQKNADYQRAMGACLDARGYSVK